MLLCLSWLLSDVQAAEIVDVRDLGSESLVRAFHIADKPKISQVGPLSDGEVDSLVQRIKRSTRFIWDNSHGQVIGVSFLDGGNRVDVSGYNQVYGAGSAQNMLGVLRDYFRVYRVKTSRF